MSLVSPACSAVQAKLQAARYNDFHLLKPDERRHVLDCPHCQAALRVAVAAQGMIVPAFQPISCDECQRDLAEFMDTAPEAPAEALQLLPYVWWHLWTCETCAAVYEQAGAVYDSHTFAALPETPDSGPPQPIAHVTRDDLNLMFPDDPAFRMRRSTPLDPDDLEETIIYDGLSESGHTVTITARQLNSPGYAIEVQLTPPFAGDVLLRCGILTLRATFDDGVALVPYLAARALTDEHAPGLEFFVQPEA